MTTYGIDAPGSRCAFDVHDCSGLVASHGGFDQHHRWPKSLGGPEHPDDLLILCPIHHRRQHALVRYMVERHVAGLTVVRSVLRGYDHKEVLTATYALTSWVSAGQPTIDGWPAPAAR